jgi:hypothetical protein
VQLRTKFLLQIFTQATLALLKTINS